MALPNLFVIGAPKCGTTALHRYLDLHPRISMSAIKEPKFFLVEGSRPRHRGPGDERASRRYVVERAEYEALFNYPAGPGSYAGESTPYYLYDHAALARMQALVPDARLIAVLREPTVRAYSNWADLREQGREKLDFASALAAEEERRALDWEPFWLYRALGLYGEQLARVYTLYPRQQVAVVHAEALAAEPGAVLAELWAFLGVEPLDERALPARRNETMYSPVTRVGRAVDGAFVHGQHLRGVVPRPLRRLGRAVVTRTLRRQATSGKHAARLRHAYGHLFAEDRNRLEELGVDTSAWGPPDAISPLGKTPAER